MTTKKFITVFFILHTIIWNIHGSGENLTDSQIKDHIILSNRVEVTNALHQKIASLTAATERLNAGNRKTNEENTQLKAENAYLQERCEHENLRKIFLEIDHAALSKHHDTLEKTLTKTNQKHQELQDQQRKTRENSLLHEIIDNMGNATTDVYCIVGTKYSKKTQCGILFTTSTLIHRIGSLPLFLAAASYYSGQPVPFLDKTSNSKTIDEYLEQEQSTRKHSAKL